LKIEEISWASTLTAFARSILNGEFRQGEILSAVTQSDYNSESGEIESETHEHIILVQQDCDLLQDHNKFSENSTNILNSILALPLVTEDKLRPQLAGSDIMRRIRVHQQERYHQLPAASQEMDLQSEGLPELFVDFRIWFSLSPRELKFQISSSGARRRCFLNSPYKEHFQNRFCGYLQRVALP
jgi:hypothetical protein